MTIRHVEIFIVYYDNIYDVRVRINGYLNEFRVPKKVHTSRDPE